MRLAAFSVFFVAVLAMLGVHGIAATPSAPSEDEFAGSVVRLQGNAFAMQNAIPRPLKVGEKVFRGDVISTGDGARLEMKMTDDAVMTLGEKTIFVVVDYISQGPEPNAAVRLLEGAFRATSGQINKVAGGQFQVLTEAATIGIRGTTFWGGKLDGLFEVALLDGKGLYVETKGGRVDLTKVGEGTAVPGADVPPTTPVDWPQQKIRRAMATVTFN